MPPYFNYQLTARDWERMIRVICGYGPDGDRLDLPDPVSRNWQKYMALSTRNRWLLEQNVSFFDKMSLVKYSSLAGYWAHILGKLHACESFVFDDIDYGAHAVSGPVPAHTMEPGRVKFFDETISATVCIPRRSLAVQTFWFCLDALAKAKSKIREFSVYASIPPDSKWSNSSWEQKLLHGGPDFSHLEKLSLGQRQYEIPYFAGGTECLNSLNTITDHLLKQSHSALKELEFLPGECPLLLGELDMSGLAFNLRKLTILGTEIPISSLMAMITTSKELACLELESVGLTENRNITSWKPIFDAIRRHQGELKVDMWRLRDEVYETNIGRFIVHGQDARPRILKLPDWTEPPDEEELVTYEKLRMYLHGKIAWGEELTRMYGE